jgi:hypothetical protein
MAAADRITQALAATTDSYVTVSPADLAEVCRARPAGCPLATGLHPIAAAALPPGQPARPMMVRRDHLEHLLAPAPTETPTS